MLVTSYGGVGALCRKTVGETRNHPQTRALVEDAMREVATVGIAAGANLTDHDVQSTVVSTTHSPQKAQRPCSETSSQVAPPNSRNKTVPSSSRSHTICPRPFTPPSTGSEHSRPARNKVGMEKDHAHPLMRPRLAGLVTYCSMPYRAPSSSASSSGSLLSPLRT